MLASESCAAASRNSSGTGCAAWSSCDSTPSRRQRLQVTARDLHENISSAMTSPCSVMRMAVRARRLGKDRLIAWAAATPHRAASAVEQAQLDAALLLEEFRKRHGRAINFPVAREKTAVLVAVRVTEHHLLHAPTRHNQIVDAAGRA